jgi:ABC-type uncharacterized transport system ATPase subunit
MSNIPYVQMTGICKYFGDLAANEDVHLEVLGGEVHALLGENGAGKSTLMNMLSGIYHPDSGSVFIHGKPIRLHSPQDAIRNGIGMIHQHFKLVEVMTAVDNIIGGQKGGLFINRKKLSRDIMELSNKYGLEIQPDKRVCDMSVGEKQTLEIMKVMYRGASILIMDEPTAVLTPQETKKLFAVVRRMKEAGNAIVIITHKLNEVMEISDRVTVLRKGKTIKTLMTDSTNQQELTDLMVGRAVNLTIERPYATCMVKALTMKNVTVKNHEHRTMLNDVSFDICGGEVLGIAGVANSGQKELCEVIAGLMPATHGSIDLKGSELIGMSPRAISRLGVSMSFVPEDRLGMGLVASMNIVDNVMLKNYRNNGKFYLNRKPATKSANGIVEQLNIMTPGILHPVKNLSGGNIQKVLLGREISYSPTVLVTAYPVRGLDINSSHQIYDLLNEQKKKGVAVIFVGEDLDVLMAFCDRIMVLCAGHVTGIVDASKVTKDQLGLMMTGQTLSAGDSENFTTSGKMPESSNLSNQTNASGEGGGNPC